MHELRPRHSVINIAYITKSLMQKKYITFPPLFCRFIHVYSFFYSYIYRRINFESIVQMSKDNFRWVHIDLLAFENVL
jgi:hypothetical protein